MSTQMGSAPDGNGTLKPAALWNDRAWNIRHECSHTTSYKAVTMSNSFNTRGTLKVGDRSYTMYRLGILEHEVGSLSRLPYSLRVLLENLLRTEDGVNVVADDIRALAAWDPQAAPTKEIAFSPARVLLQDFTGVPAVVDLAAMREAMAAMGGDPAKINPLQPAELVIDHSVQVDAFGSSDAFGKNTELEYERNRERYQFLRWGQGAFRNFRVVPPETGIVHQVNLEYLARVVFTTEGDENVAYPDTLVGTDSHTTMVNGLGVLGWGVGGIEAEAAMLGQPVSMLIPQVVGFKLTGRLAEGATATDLVLVVTEMLRRHGVVGKFVEFYGAGLSGLPLADRATIANMAPEYGATCGIFPVDEETLRYLRFTGRSDEQIALVEAYMKEQGLFHDAETVEAQYSAHLDLDLGSVRPSISGPRRPQDRILLSDARQSFVDALKTFPSVTEGTDAAVTLTLNNQHHAIGHGAVVIAAITSCTNTSNPSVMVAAGLLAKKAVEKGLRSQPWVKTSLAPGSKVVTRYLDQAGLTSYLDALGFQTVGYGCTTCIGNSGPLPKEVSSAVNEGNLVVCSVLSGNRNFEGRINQDIKANYLMSPPLVVAYALAGRMDIDIYNDPIGTDTNGAAVFLRDLWPTQQEVEDSIAGGLTSEMFRSTYADVFTGDVHWSSLPSPTGQIYAWDSASTYVKNPPYFQDMPRTAADQVDDIVQAKVLAILGDSVTTDHISPAGSIKVNSPAGQYLIEHGVDPADFNSYGSRRGNHEVMMRGTFANIRLRNRMVPGVEGGYTVYLPSGETTTIYDAAMRYQNDGTPLVILAGKEYGSGSSRDWAAKGTRLLGVRGVIAESFERIHRSNLVGMGVLPLEFVGGANVESLGLVGNEEISISGLTALFASGFPPERIATVRASRPDGSELEFSARVRIDTPQELQYFLHGGILQYVLRQLLGTSEVVAN